MEEQVKQKNGRPKGSKAIILPKDREVMEMLIKATCHHFEIVEEVLLLKTNQPDAANVRYLCMYLIMTNTSLKDYVVADRFGATRTSVFRGVQIIDTHKRIYRQTLDNLKAIASIANSFEKKYEWQISL